MTNLIDVANELAENTFEWCQLNRDKFLLPKSLTGMCAIGSAKAQKEYSKKYKNKFKMEVCYNKKHCFNIINDSIILDVTASQFGIKDKNIVDKYIVDEYGKFQFKLIDAKLSNHWKIVRKFKTISNLIKHLEDEYWPSEQIPKFLVRSQPIKKS